MDNNTLLTRKTRKKHLLVHWDNEQQYDKPGNPSK